MRVIRKEDAVTREWSGGTTTELAIFPENAVYADRDFLWRLSTAEVLDEKSTFTKLPDYYRFLTIRKGKLRIKHDDGEWYVISPGDVTDFDGGALTVSEGVVTDYNLMVRKGSAEGRLLTLKLKADETASLSETVQKLLNSAYSANPSALTDCGADPANCTNPSGLIDSANPADCARNHCGSVNSTNSVSGETLMPDKGGTFIAIYISDGGPVTVGTQITTEPVDNKNAYAGEPSGRNIPLTEDACRNGVCDTNERGSGKLLSAEPKVLASGDLLLIEPGESAADMFMSAEGESMVIFALVERI